MKGFWTRLCCSLLRLLGIAAVGASVSACYGVPYNTRAMYGVPTVDLDIAGVVLNENDEPVQGIAVSYSDSSDGIGFVTSEKDGQFNIKTQAFPGDPNLYLFVKDIDGDENGSYQTDSLKIDQKSFVKVKEGDGAWYQGAYELKELEVKLKPKQ